MSFEIKPKATILIVDDQSANLGLLLEFLKDYSFKIILAHDGENAIEKAEKRLPDIILLDVIMPGIDGFETCRRLKESPATKDIPIIFMTALSETIDKVKGLTIGAVDYITKPFEFDEVLVRIQLHLRLRQLNQQLLKQNERLAQEIKERKKSEETIREQAKLLDITTDAIFVQDLSGRILYWNKGAERLYGWKSEEAIAKNALELLYPETAPPLKTPQQNVLSLGKWQGELHQIKKDTSKVIVESRWTLVSSEEGEPKSILTVNTDITEKKQLESQFLRAQRLESLGILAGGIAHDLNNILTPIMMSIQLLELKLTDEQSEVWLEIVESNVKRGADLVKQVLSFSRGMEGERTLIQVKHIISEIKKIIQETFTKSIDISIDVSPDLGVIYGDVTQLHQVLLNLCVNAGDAMPTGGKLTISADNIYLDENYARMYLEAQVGHYILIRVSDTGVGMNKGTIERIFEPFFTTKERGKGTGLGLSTALGIIKSHGGFVTVDSELGKGTTFKVYLPTTQTTATGEPLETQPNLPKGNGELVLVVDDEDALREITQSILENHNYRVVLADDGVKAVSIYAQNQSEIELVLVDMMMPSMDGLTTIRILEKINPQIKVIAVSGLVSTQEKAEILAQGVKAFLPKPYTAEELLTMLQTAIQES
ncbi:MAG: response regulator [Chroococcales cyanobacterium]